MGWGGAGGGGGGGRREDRLKMTPGDDFGANVPMKKNTSRESSGPREHKGLSIVLEADLQLGEEQTRNRTAYPDVERIPRREGFENCCSLFLSIEDFTRWIRCVHVDAFHDRQSVHEINRSLALVIVSTF